MKMLSVMLRTLYYTGYCFALFITPWVLYFVFWKKDVASTRCSEKDIVYPIKYIVAKRKIKYYQKKWHKYINRLGNDVETNILIPHVHVCKYQLFNYCMTIYVIIAWNVEE
ncbi:unnamed protein product [Acanthoscelides obtectus]|uniref:Uncharacterized protein n=1 Tax=Acanthoscelides obtectus TaxID=200917 RepID=A0A9P0NQR6_ACAOB|nr:unnamed protein product [Acanthoscelides obtectus]CAK1654986.1 hypothetical protein AOBTE_LOCUS18947 [Acanthoscelides obtectus]